MTMPSPRRSALCLLPLLAAVAPACRRASATPSPSTAAPDPTALHVTVERPVSRRFDGRLLLPGEIRPDAETTVYAKVPGYIADIRCDEGDFLPRDAVIAHIEAPELASDLAKAQDDEEIKRLAYERLKQVHDQDARLVPAQAFDTARVDYLSAQRTRERLQTMASYLVLRAPFAGVVTRRDVDPGALVQPGRGVYTSVIVLMKIDRVRIHVAVPEANAPLVAVGRPAAITVDALPGRTFAGKVARTAFALDPASRTLDAEIDVDNPPPYLLRPGFYAHVAFDPGPGVSAVAVPSSSVLEDGSGASVFVIDRASGGATARRRAIHVLADDGTSVLVGDGLSPEDEIVVAGRDLVGDGLRVDPVEVDP